MSKKSKRDIRNRIGVFIWLKLSFLIALVFISNFGNLWVSILCLTLFFISLYFMEKNLSKLWKDTGHYKKRVKR